MTFAHGTLGGMLDSDRPAALDVEFDPPALYRERMVALRSQRIAAWGWLGLTGLATALIVWPLLHADTGLRLLAVVWIVLLGGMAAVSVKCFRAVARCAGWADGSQPKTALRLSSQGLWLAGVRLYAWDEIHGLRLRSMGRRRYVVVELRRDVRPDIPVVAGLNELVASRSRHRLLPPRGPRLLTATLAISLPNLKDAALRYSDGRVTLR
jgi:hypothetical protein